MTTITNITQWIEHPELLNSSTLYELRTLLLRYPYFQSARLLYLYNLYLMHDASFGAELKRSALFVADLKVLFYLIEGDSYRINVRKQKKIEYEPATGTDASDGGDRTLALIDSFLSKQPDEQFLTDELDYTTDYASYLLNADDADEAGGDSVVLKPIDAMTQDSTTYEQLDRQDDTTPDPADEPDGVQASETDMDEGYFTETLAKIYIKQHRYEKALEIIKKLSLKYPKKNIYFADQIRFLEKLIANERTKLTK